MEHINTWKNSEVFKQQLELNLRELNGLYPNHWEEFLVYIKHYDIKSVLDLGCGVGAYYKLLQDNFPGVKYVGMDYAFEAVDLAKKHWGYKEFYQKDLWDLTQKDLESYDLIHMGALLDVLPNGDEALSYILSLSPKSVLVSRMELYHSNENRAPTTYTAYDTITTYKYTHKLGNVLRIIKKYDYSYSLEGENKKNLYLQK